MARPPPEHSIQTFLSAKSDLGKLIEKVAALESLQAPLQKNLPSPLNEHCRVANYQNGILVIETDSAAWKTQLMYLAPEILSRLRAVPVFHRLNSLKFYIRPLENPRSKPKNTPVLSETNSKLLNKLKNYLSST